MISDCPFCVGRLGYIVSTCEECCGSGEIVEDTVPAKREQSGTLTAHGKTWPMYSRPVYAVDVSGYVDAEMIESREAFEQQLTEILAPFGLTVKVTLNDLHEMSPEDQTEKDALDKMAYARAD